jgi:DNA-binding response OmpR family regulator
MIKFSEYETKMLKILKPKKVYSIKELTEKFYGEDQPFEAGNRIAGLIRRIERKCEANSSHEWTIFSELLNGEKYVWRAKKVFKRGKYER